MVLRWLALLACAFGAASAEGGEGMPSRLPGPDGLDAQMLEIVQEKVAKGVVRNDHEVVNNLLAKGADASAVGEYNYTVLMWAIVRRKSEVVQILLDAGADTEHTNDWGEPLPTSSPLPYGHVTAHVLIAYL